MQPRKKKLLKRTGSGSGELAQGGYYTTLIDPTSDNFTLTIVKISYDHAACTRPALPPFLNEVQAENVTFQLDESMFGQKNSVQLACWRSNFETETPLLFEQQPDVVVQKGVAFTVLVEIGDYFTFTTVQTGKHGALRFVAMADCQCSNAQMLKCANAQMLKCANAQMLKCSNAQTLKCTNAQILNWANGKCR